jgi:hypothetical protein
VVGGRIWCSFKIDEKGFITCKESSEGISIEGENIAGFVRFEIKRSEGNYFTSDFFLI